MRVALSVYASKLKNVAGFGRGTSDPYAVISKLPEDENEENATVIGRTETIENALSPNWAKVFVLDYELGTPFPFAVTIMDDPKNGGRNMGHAVFGLGEVLGARGSTKARVIKQGHGTIFATARKSTGAGTLRLKLRGEKLKNVEGWFGKSDPFFELCRHVDLAGNSVWDVVYRSEDVRDNLDPEWNLLDIELSFLCGGDFNQPIRIHVLDHERSGRHVLMGSFKTTVNHLVESYLERHALLMTSRGKETGTIYVDFAELSLPDEMRNSTLSRNILGSMPRAIVQQDDKPTFIDYISGGCDVGVIVAIDYSSHNGKPSDVVSLHNLDPHPDSGKNDYQKAINSIVGIMKEYDDDKKFPVVGFGASIDGNDSNCFQCGVLHEAHGVAGVLKAYESVLRNKSLEMHDGVTDYTEVIRCAGEHAKTRQETAASSGKQAYSILLVITRAANVDVTVTVGVLKEVIDAPLSVVFVGLGDGDFAKMEYLDHALQEHGRDFVTFVHFNKYRSHRAALSSATLREIPEQMVSYFQVRGIQPLPPVQIDEEEILASTKKEEEAEIHLDFSLSNIEVSLAATGYDSYDYDC